MVVSNIIQNIKFKEEKEVEKHDKKTKVSVYRINLFDTEVNVSLGKVNTSMYDDIYFAPVYLILNENSYYWLCWLYRSSCLCKINISWI